MLVLSRQRDETIMIGDRSRSRSSYIRGDKVRLGITAPTRIAVHRKEVYEAIKREYEQAARLQADLGQSELDVIGRTIAPGPAKTRGRPLASRVAERGANGAPLPPGAAAARPVEVRRAASDARR